jgi:c-di-GMP-binding flagellar brake protein YcgR
MSREEKRKHRRIPVSLSLLYNVKLPIAVRLHTGNIERPAFVQDISEGGLGLLTNSEIPPEALLKVKFSLTNKNEQGAKKTQNFELDVQVCYCMRVKNAYRVGVSFVNIVMSERLFVSNYIKTGCSTKDPN